MDFISVWTMSKRYISGAIVGVIVAGITALGINVATSPELQEQIRLMVDALLMGVFYIVTILWKSWRQKKELDAGHVLPERVESASTAREHGMPLGSPIRK